MKTKLLIILMACLLSVNLTVSVTACPPPPCPDCQYWDPYSSSCIPYGDCWGGCPDCETCVSCYCQCTSDCCEDEDCGDPNCCECVDCNCVTFDVNSVSVDKDFACVGCDVTFTVTTNPSGHEDDVSWSAPGGDPNSGTGASFTTHWDSAGTKTATASLCGNSDSNDVTVVEVASLEPDDTNGITEFDDGDGDPNTRSFVACIVDPNADPNIVRVIATPNPSVDEPNLPDCWSFTGGTEVNDLEHTVDRTTPGKTVLTCTCNTSSKQTTIYVLEAKIKEPEGSKDANPNPTSSFSATAPYRFDFQWVKDGSPGSYSNTIEGEIKPASAITDLNDIDYVWTVTQGEFNPHDTGQPKQRTGTETPTYKATTVSSSVTLTLNPGACDPPTKTLEVFEDHLRKDRNNFGTGISCKGSWKFTKYNVTITMGGTWNCHSSANHAYNGSGNIGGSVGLDNTITGWAKNTFTPPITWADVNSVLDVGDVVAFYSNSGTSLQHSHTVLSGTTTYGANNEALTGNPTWKWAECTSKDYWDIQATNNPPWPDCDKLIVYNKP